MTAKELIAERDRLIKIQKREYERLGNTQRCQELFEEITKLNKQIKSK